MGFLTLLPTIFQIVLGLMSVAEKYNAPGAAKKAIVVQGIQTLAPVIVKALPASVQSDVQDGVKIANAVTNIAVNAIDGLHEVAKANNLYPGIEQTLGQAADGAAGLQQIVSAFSSEQNASG